MDDEFHPPPFSYDVDAPCIDVDEVFPDVDQCKLSVVTHHTILNDHAFEIVKMDNTRFRAICKTAASGCNWKFVASTSKKYIGCKVPYVLTHKTLLFVADFNFLTHKSFTYVAVYAG